MALSKYMLARLINEDGHLIVEGTETEEELRMAAINLFSHYTIECRNRYAGIPVHIALPDITALAPSSNYRHPRKNKRGTKAALKARVRDRELEDVPGF